MGSWYSVERRSFLPECGVVAARVEASTPQPSPEACLGKNLIVREHCSMDTTALATAWHRDGSLEVETRQVLPNVSRAPYAHPFDARALILAGELTLTWEGQTHTFRVGETFDMPAGCMHSEQCTGTARRHRCSRGILYVHDDPF